MVNETGLRTPGEQVWGLKLLADLVGKSECNCWIRNDPGDVAYLAAADTPGASQIVYATGGYDVWTTGAHNLQATNLSIEDAAKVVVAEYHLAKAARIKARHPDLSADEIMKTLAKGYQKAAP
jgi:hypothetical protein